MPGISTIILTYNEGVHIARAIESVSALRGTVHVVDSFSTDDTCSIARANEAVVTQHAFMNQAQQLKWTLEHLPITTEWVLRLDADEVLTEELSAEIERRLPTLPSTVNGVYLRLRYIFMGRTLLHGGRSLKLLRLFRRDRVIINERWMDERFELIDGTHELLNGFIYDWNLKDISFFTNKHNTYATREAIEVLRRKYVLWDVKAQTRATAVSDRVKNSMKANFYRVVPFWLSSVLYFIYRYVLLLGFLSAHEGLVYHLLQGLWYRFLVGAKVDECDRHLRRLANPEARLAELAKLTGYPLEQYAQQFSRMENRAPSPVD